MFIGRLEVLGCLKIGGIEGFCDDRRIEVLYCMIILRLEVLGCVMTGGARKGKQ